MSKDTEPRGIDRRIVRFTPEASDALSNASRDLGVTANQAVNIAVSTLKDLLEISGAGNILVIIDPETRIIQGEISINPNAVVSDEHEKDDMLSNVIQFPGTRREGA